MIKMNLWKTKGKIFFVTYLSEHFLKNELEHSCSMLTLTNYFENNKTLSIIWRLFTFQSDFTLSISYNHSRMMKVAMFHDYVQTIPSVRVANIPFSHALFFQIKLNFYFILRFFCFHFSNLFKMPISVF